MRSGFALAAAVLSLSLSLLAPPLAAQAWKGRGRMQGIVTDPSEQPVTGARVTLRLEDQGPETLLTDDGGRWSILGLAGGTWTIVIEADGYMLSEGTVPLAETAIGPAKPIRVQLKPIPEEQRRQTALEWIEQGNELLQQEQYAAARAEYEKARAALGAESHPPILRGVARTYYGEGDVDQALAALERALAIDANDVDSLQLVINLLVEQGREDEAQAYAARLPEGERMDATAALNLGIDLYNEGDLAGALEHFERVVSDNPDLADGYYYRGLVLLNQGEGERARADFERLLALDPSHPKAEEVRQFLAYLQAE